jgi:hypothetical protein
MYILSNMLCLVNEWILLELASLHQFYILEIMNFLNVFLRQKLGSFNYGKAEQVLRQVVWSRPLPLTFQRKESPWNCSETVTRCVSAEVWSGTAPDARYVTLHTNKLWKMLQARILFLFIPPMLFVQCECFIRCTASFWICAPHIN